MTTLAPAVPGLVPTTVRRAAPDAPAGLTPIDEFLGRQAELTAVERFAAAHDAGAARTGDSFWRDRLPATPPGPGQQYGFEVDLDACTGCKACVTACHNLNGLEEGEAWRRTGTLHGLTDAGPVVQTVTAACHHCLDPACLNGCPADAYEKDPVTGIVRHLDDNCIGCQYCTLTCPYDVPEMRPSLGIVRKCDMCSDRLAEGEAPACVQGCPTGAITIGLVDVAAVRAASVAEARVVPGAPSSSFTAPTTVYRSERLTGGVSGFGSISNGTDVSKSSRRDAAPGEDCSPDVAQPSIGEALDGVDDAAQSTRPAHAHPPLTAMLVLTQVAVGTLAADAALTWLGIVPDTSAVALLGLLVGLVALGASLLHLGRPLLAWRAVLGLRHSWLSREIVVFSAFAGAAVADAVLVTSGWFEDIRPVTRGGVLVCGLAGIACSVELYVVTRRTWWSRWRTAGRFLATAMTGGVLVAGAVHLTGGASPDRSRLLTILLPVLAASLAVGILVPIIGLPRRGRIGTGAGDLAATRALLRHQLTGWVTARAMAAGAALLLVAITSVTTISDSPGPLTAIPVALAALIAIVGEFFERHMFFTASAPPRMPGEPS